MLTKLAAKAAGVRFRADGTCRRCCLGRDGRRGGGGAEEGRRRGGGEEEGGGGGYAEAEGDSGLVGVEEADADLVLLELQGPSTTGSTLGKRGEGGTAGAVSAKTEIRMVSGSERSASNSANSPPDTTDTSTRFRAIPASPDLSFHSALQANTHSGKTSEGNWGRVVLTL